MWAVLLSLVATVRVQRAPPHSVHKQLPRRPAWPPTQAPPAPRPASQLPFRLRDPLCPAASSWRCQAWGCYPHLSPGAGPSEQGPEPGQTVRSAPALLQGSGSRARPSPSTSVGLAAPHLPASSWSCKNRMSQRARAGVPGGDDVVPSGHEQETPSHLRSFALRILH